MNAGGGILRTIPRHLLVGALGAAFALGVYQIWDLEGRWFVIAIVSVLLVSMSMTFAGRFSERLFILLLFFVPLAGFRKFFFLEDHVTWNNTLSLGITDLVVAGLYIAWGFRIFVLREELPPRPEKADTWVLLLIVATIMSVWGAVDTTLVLFALENLVSQTLIYLYVSRNFRRRHVPWLMASVTVAVFVEGGISIVQNRFDMLVGLIKDKGAGGEQLNDQYVVPGIEEVTRGTGTTYDSHSLGLYLAMLMPYLVLFLYSERVPRRWRLASGVVLLVGIAGWAVSYSRSAWIVGAFSFGMAAIALLIWRERHVFPSLVGVAIAGLVVAPWAFTKIFERLYRAPEIIIRGRFEQYPVAWSIWTENFLFGSGAGNYNVWLESHNLDWAYPVLVHNVPLYIGAELGLFGVVVFYAMIVAAIYRLWRVVRLRREPDRRLALAAALSLFAFMLDGLTSPLFREPVVYTMLWVTLGLSVALTRNMHDEQADRDATPAADH